MKKWLVGLASVGMWAAAAWGDLTSPATLPVEYAGESGWTNSNLDALTGWDATGLGSPYGAPNASAKFDGAGDNVIIYFDGEPSGIAYTVRRSDAGAMTNQYEAKLQESADNSTWSDVQVFDGSELTGTLAPFSNALSSSSRYVKFLYSVKATGQNFGLGYVNIASSGPLPPATTNVKFTASVAAVNENAGTYEITVIKTLAEGDVSGEIVLSGTATPGDDYTVDTTNFTLNGATTSATVTVTIVDDEDEEPAETVVLTLANVAGGTAVSPSAFTLTIKASDMGEPTIWLNELNYDPAGTDDAGTEWLEVAGPSGVDLSAFVVVLYNGSGGAPYNTTALSGTIDDEGCGYGAVDLVYDAANSLQNGAPDAVALAQVSGGVTSLVQFLSYEGVFTGVGGPADGVESVDIGTQLNTAEGTLQLGGTATNYNGFAWETNAPSRGSLNANQSITGCTPAPVTNVLFTASAASVDENAGTYEITVIKNRAEGDVSGEIVLSGTATPGDDYAVDTTNFTLNGAVTSATFTVTIVDDDENESAETVVLTLANVVNGTIASPSVFTLTIGISDVPAEGIADFRFNTVPYLQVTAKDGNLAVSDMALSAGTIETAAVAGDYFTDEPFIEETAGWTATSQAEAKAFQFTITPAEGASMTIDAISFKAYATSAGPSAYGFDVGGGLATHEVDAPSAALLVVSQAVAGVVGQTGPIVVKIQGWANGSRETSGAGVFRLDDVVIHGSVSTGPLEFGVTFDQNSGFEVEAGSTDVIVATAANGTEPYSYAWSSTLEGAYCEIQTNEFTILATAPLGVYTAQVVATDSSDPVQQVTNSLSFSVTTPVVKYAIAIVTNAPENGTVTTTPAAEAEAGATVTVTATPASGYALDTLAVVGADDTPLEVAGTGNTRTFTMPAQPVTVTATFAVRAGSDLFISEVADPSGTGGDRGRFVELYNTGAEAIDLAAGQWYLAKQVNGGTTWDNVALTGTVNAASTYVVSFNLTNYTAAYPSAPLPNQTSGNISGSGDDGYFLYSGGNNATGVMQDAYGVINEDGTGMPWEYTDSRAVRNADVTAGNPTWTASEWTITDPAVYADMTPGVHPDGAAVISVGFDKTEGFEVEQGTATIITAAATNGVGSYTYGWATDMAEGDFAAEADAFTISDLAAVGSYYATVTATDSSDPVQVVSNTIHFSVVVPAMKYAISIVTNAPENGTVSTTPETEAAADATVTVTAAPASGYALDTLAVVGADDTPLEVAGTGNTRTFTMPAQPVTITVTFVVYEAPDVLITFETGTLPGAYAANTATLEDGKVWSTMRVVKSNSESDKKIDTLSARLYPQTGTNAVLQQTEAYAEPISEISYWVASYGSDTMANVTLTVEVSSDGTNWEAVESLAGAEDIPATLTEHVVATVPANAVYVRFVATAAAVSNKRINLDNIGFNLGAASPALSYTGATTVQLGQAFALTFTLDNGTASGWEYLLESASREDLDNGSVNVFNWTPTATGTYYLTMTALDEAVNPIATREVTLTVNPGNPDPPAIPAITAVAGAGFHFAVPDGYTVGRVEGAVAEVAGQAFAWTLLNSPDDYEVAGGQVTIKLVDQDSRLIRVWFETGP